MVNTNKSGIMFSTNTSISDKETAMNILNIHRLLENDCYLGLPLLFSRNRKREFRAIKERLWARINGWGKKLLSRAGKAVLIQSVPQAIPLYVMSCFKLPTDFVHELNMIIAGYWWGDSSIKKKIHWRN